MKRSLRDADGQEAGQFARTDKHVRQSVESAAGDNPLMRLQRTVGNQAVQQLLQSDGSHAEPQVSRPTDADELEAERVAEGAVATTDSPAPNNELFGKDQAAAGQDGAVIGSSDNRNNFLASLGPGRALDPALRQSMESRLGHDLSRVRIHTDSRTNESARALNARAYTVGTNVVFDQGEYAPQSRRGQKLLAHELTHVTQQSRAGTKKAKIQREVHPEDVSSEMVGRQFHVAGPFTSGTIQLGGGEPVEIVAWENTLTTASVQLPYPFVNAHIPFNIPKHLLRAATAGVRGIAHYGAGVAQQATTVEQGEQAIAQEKSRPGGPRPGEIPRLEGLQQVRQQTMNRRLIQETMYNRFDPIIAKWVAFYNQQFNLTGRNALDPELVKSLLFQETQMGTAGQHLEVDRPGQPISHPVKSRFNLGQVIDTSASALLIMIREMQPALITTYHLENISTDLSAAQSELAHLRGIKKPTAAQQARLTVLAKLSQQSWQGFLWGYKAPGQANGFWQAVMDLFASSGAGQPALNLDYDFWIRAAVRWLFEKRQTVGSWAEAIRAYNGSGARAQHYRDAVQQRASAAQASTDFVPSGI